MVARRRGPVVDSGHVTGQLRRTVEGWRALGAPVCLFEVAAAVGAYRRCVPPSWDYGRLFTGPGDDGLLADVKGSDFVAGLWFADVGAYFLRRVGALTEFEAAYVERYPRLCEPSRSHYRRHLVDVELFGAGRGAA